MHIISSLLLLSFGHFYVHVLLNYVLLCTLSNYFLSREIG